jgi:hypothetical protein
VTQKVEWKSEGEKSDLALCGCDRSCNALYEELYDKNKLIKSIVL